MTRLCGGTLATLRLQYLTARGLTELLSLVTLMRAVLAQSSWTALGHVFRHPFRPLCSQWWRTDAQILACFNDASTSSRGFTLGLSSWLFRGERVLWVTVKPSVLWWTVNPSVGTTAGSRLSGFTFRSCIAFLMAPPL